MKYTQAVELKKNGLLKKVSYNEFEVADEFIWYISYDKKDTYIIVPSGFKTNFGSIPRIIQAFFSPTKFLAYVLHDFLYSNDCKIIFQDEFETHIYPYTRKQADQIMGEAIKVEWGWFLERHLIYLWVRIWWFLHYKKK